MSSKKKKKQKQSVENKTESTVVNETGEMTGNQQTELHEAEAPVIGEIKYATAEDSVTDAGSGLSVKKNSVGGKIFGTVLVAAVLFLAVCLYKTVTDLQTVQATSDELRIELNTTKDMINGFLEEASSAASEKKDELSEEEQGDIAGEEIPQVTKKPRVTPVPETYTVCIDAGHGAHDTGAILELEDGTRRLEKDDNLWLAQLVQKELEAYGIKVLMTREDDSFLELYDRTLMANAMDVDALISFHRNAYYLNGKMNERVKGVEIWIHSSRPTEARRLANAMLDAILDVGGMNDRGVRYGSMTDFEEDYAINRRALMTSMIVEMGFISNEADNTAFDTNGEAYAKAMAKEIYEWLTGTE
jgi:N-acetylmuramoyl-L-alanine amidase